MDDMLSVSDELRARRYKRILATLLIVYFFAMFIYMINITGRVPPFYTRVIGYASYTIGQPITMRISVVGVKEQLALREFNVKAELLQPAANTALNLYSGGAGRDTYVDIQADTRGLAPGDYILRITTSHPDYEGVELNEIRLSLLKAPLARAVEVQKLDEKLTQKPHPIKAATLDPPLELRFVPGNGRFVPNLSNDILVVAEALATGLPVDGLSVTLSGGGKTLAELTTDAMGLARFTYYSHTLGGERLVVVLKDKKGTTLEREITLGPQGSQLIAQPARYLIPAGEPIRFTLEALSKGPWHIDLFRHGTWLFTDKKAISGARTPIDLPTNRDLTGMIHVQVAKDFSNPGTTFDAFNVFVYDPASDSPNPEDPRLQDATGDDLEDLRLEAPFKKLWSYLNAASQYDRNTIEAWQRKLNALSTREMPYRPGALAEQILREIEKDYILLPILLDSRQAREKAFRAKQSSDRMNLILLLAFSGVVIVLAMGYRIYREVQLREVEEGLEYSKSHIGGMLILLAIIVIAYALMIYLLSTLDWYTVLG